MVMILQTQSRSSSEKGYIADTRPRNFDAGIFLPRLLAKPIISPIYKDPEKTKIAILGDGVVVEWISARVWYLV